MTEQEGKGFPVIRTIKTLSIKMQEMPSNVVITEKNELFLGLTLCT